MSGRHLLIGMIVGGCLSLGGIALAHAGDGPSEDIPPLSSDGSVEAVREGEAAPVEPKAYAEIKPMEMAPWHVANCKEVLANDPSDSACEIIIAQDAGELTPGNYSHTELRSVLNDSEAVAEAKAG